MKAFNSLKKYILFSAKYLLRSPNMVRKDLRIVEKLYGMSPEELDQYKEKEFLRLFRWTWDNSNFYRQLYTGAGIRPEDINGLDDLKRLPIVTKDMVKAHGDEILTLPKAKVHAQHTSGTTGTPLMVYRDMATIHREQAYLYMMHRNAGFKTGERMVSLRGRLTKEDKPLKVHIENTLYLSAYNINPATVEDYYRRISRFKPKAIEGYPSSLYALALMLKDAKLKLSVPIAFTSSETLDPNQRELIEQQLGCEIFDHYGMTEGTVALFELGSHDGYYELPGWVITEWVDDGEISTSLINFAFPLIRYKSNDIVEFTDEPRFRITRILGRTEDFITCKDGSKIERLDFVFKGINNVRKGQILVENPGKIIISVVPEQDFSDIDRQAIEKNMIERVGKDNLDYQIRLIQDQDIILTKSGKYKFILDLGLSAKMRPKIGVKGH